MHEPCPDLLGTAHLLSEQWNPPLTQTLTPAFPSEAPKQTDTPFLLPLLGFVPGPTCPLACT